MGVTQSIPPHRIEQQPPEKGKEKEGRDREDEDEDEGGEAEPASEDVVPTKQVDDNEEDELEEEDDDDDDDAGTRGLADMNVEEGNRGRANKSSDTAAAATTNLPTSSSSSSSSSPFTQQATGSTLVVRNLAAAAAEYEHDSTYANEYNNKVEQAFTTTPEYRLASSQLPHSEEHQEDDAPPTVFDLNHRDTQMYFHKKMRQFKEQLAHLDAAIKQLHLAERPPPLAVRQEHLGPLVQVFTSGFIDLLHRVYPSIRPLPHLTTLMSQEQAPDLHHCLDELRRLLAASPCDSYKSQLVRPSLFSRCVQSRTSQHSAKYLRKMLDLVHLYQHKYAPHMYGPFPRFQVFSTMLDAVGQYAGACRSEDEEVRRILLLHDHLIKVASLGVAGAAQYAATAPIAFTGLAAIGNDDSHYYLLCRGYKSLCRAAGLCPKKTSEPRSPGDEADPFTDFAAYRKAIAFLLWAHNLPHRAASALSPTFCLGLFLYAGIGGMLKDLDPCDAQLIESHVPAKRARSRTGASSTAACRADTGDDRPSPAGADSSSTARKKATGKRKGPSVDDLYVGPHAAGLAAAVHGLREPGYVSQLVYEQFPAACGPTYVSQVYTTLLHDEVYLRGGNFYAGGTARTNALDNYVRQQIPFPEAEERASS